MTLPVDQLKELATTVRILSAEGVEKANSGHPGMPMGAADYSAVLWSKYLNFDPACPDWPNRDRFVLSAGHGSMLLYSLLHLFGYKVSMDDLKAFRQWESITPGHPEFGMTPGVETTTGPLGAGFSNGVGLALSQKMLAARYSEDLFNYRVFGIVSDGDLMEGIASEAASLAGHLALDNLIYIYDDNEISIGGRTGICFTEDVQQRFSSYGWHVISIDGHDLNAADQALAEAVEQQSKPTIICARTTIGYGSPNKADSSGVHGSPLGDDELAATKDALGWEAKESFFIPKQVQDFCAECVEKGSQVKGDWDKKFNDWKSANKELASAYEKQAERTIVKELKEELITTFSAIAKPEATRSLSGKAIQVVAKHVAGFVGGSADLEPSTKTLISDSTDIAPGEFAGKNIRFGVREHAMGGLVNGLAYTRSWIPYASTFLVFSDYMRPAIRLAALSHLQSIFIFTHDSFWVGEDGPTHQPIEQTGSLRMIPNLHVYRPADGLETAMAYWAALNRKNGPTAILCTRQNVPVLERESGFKVEDIEKGAYVVSGSENQELTIVATGSEVGTACEAQGILASNGVSCRIVSIPCVEKYLELSDSDRQAIIPSASKKVLIEAGSSIGWERIVGADALFICKDSYGASAPGEVLAKEFGFTAELVAGAVKDWHSK